MEEWMGLTNILSFTAYIYEINRRGVTPIGGLVYMYMCLPGLWVNLRYFALVMSHVL